MVNIESSNRANKEERMVMASQNEFFLVNVLIEKAQSGSERARQV